MEYSTALRINDLQLQHTTTWMTITNNDEQEKTETKEYILCDFIYMKYKKQLNLTVRTLFMLGRDGQWPEEEREVYRVLVTLFISWSQ